MSSLLDRLRNANKSNLEDNNKKAVNPLFSKLREKSNNPLLRKNLEENNSTEKNTNDLINNEKDQKDIEKNEKELKESETVVEKTIESAEKPTESSKEEVRKEIKEEIKEEVKEEVKTKKRRKKRSEEEKNNEENTTTASPIASNKNGLLVAEYANLDIFGMKIGFEEAANIIRANYFDEEWFKYRDEVYKEFQSIKIDKDLNMGTIKVVLEEINLLKDKILLPLTEAKEIITMLSDKDCGIGTVIKTKAAVESQTSNATARTAAGFEALQKVNANGTDINLLTILMAAKLRYNFLDALMNNLENKRQSLITMNSALKIEASLVQ